MVHLLIYFSILVITNKTKSTVKDHSFGQMGDVIRDFISIIKDLVWEHLSGQTVKSI